MDVTDRKKTENALRESEERFRDLLRNATDAIVAVNQAGKIVLVSESAKKMFGYRDDEMLGKNVEILVPERFRSAHADSCGNTYGTLSSVARKTDAIWSASERMAASCRWKSASLRCKWVRS